MERPGSATVLYDVPRKKVSGIFGIAAGSVCGAGQPLILVRLNNLTLAKKLGNDNRIGFCGFLVIREEMRLLLARKWCRCCHLRRIPDTPESLSFPFTKEQTEKRGPALRSLMVETPLYEETMLELKVGDCVGVIGRSAHAGECGLIVGFFRRTAGTRYAIIFEDGCADLPREDLTRVAADMCAMLRRR